MVSENKHSISTNDLGSAEHEESNGHGLIKRSKSPLFHSSVTAFDRWLALAMLPALGIELVQLGVIVVTNLAIGMLTPPMGICLIVAGTISGDRLGAIAWRIGPFLLVLLIDLMVVTFYAPLTMWLAGMVAR